MHTRRAAFRLTFLTSCRALLVAAGVVGCRAPVDHVVAQPAVGQWIWTRADAARYQESAGAVPALEAGVFIGSVRCDTAAHRLIAQAGLPPTVVPAARPVAVIRLEDGLYGCRTVSDPPAVFERQLDSAVRVLRRRGGDVPYAAVQLDHDAPQRRLAAWAGSVRYLRSHALVGDSVWVTSIIAHLREESYRSLFRDVVSGHVLQVFDTGEQATPAGVAEAVRLVRRADLPFRIGLGAFERDTPRGPTYHRAWFATVPRFAAVPGYAGVWIFPAGQRWVTLFRETM